MLVGDSTEWVGRFRSLDARFMERIAEVWPDCLSRLPSQPHEDTITANLVNHRQRDPGVRRYFHWIGFQYEPFGYTPEGMAYSRGRVDMAVLLDQDRDTYLAYECKRLNVKSGSGRRSLAGKYVRDGISRFVKGQYSESLPVGCMLGYVLDGDLGFATARVHAKIVECRRLIALVDGPRSDDAIGCAIRYYSRHRREATGGEIEVRHALLPMCLHPEAGIGRGHLALAPPLA